MEKNEYLLLNRIYQDCEVGMQSIDKVLKKIENETLKNQFKNQFEAYEKIMNRADALAMTNNKELKDNNVFKKSSNKLLIFSFFVFKSLPALIVSTIPITVPCIIISTMCRGVLSVHKERYIITVCLIFLKMQEDFYGKLKKQLSKV